MPITLILLAVLLAFLGEVTHDTSVFKYVSDAALLLICKGTYELFKALNTIRVKEEKKQQAEAEKIAKKEKQQAALERQRAEADHQFEIERREAQANAQQGLKQRKLVH